MTLSMIWGCSGLEQDFLEPGVCADGKARRARYEVRAHGDHNPRHGGQFFMAQDAWHHLEGTLQPGGVFRLFFYDNYTKPLDARRFAGRAVTKEVWDPAAKTSQDVEFVDLRPGKDPSTLEAALHRVALPARISAKIRFNPKQQPQRFDFLFTEPSAEPPARTRVLSSSDSTEVADQRPNGNAAASPKPPKSSGLPPVSKPDASETSTDALQLIVIAPPPTLLPVLDESLLPDSIPELIGELRKRTVEVRRTIADGNLSQVWLPAMAAKTVALALDSASSRGALAAGSRVRVRSAVSRIVAAAWELDSLGDMGNSERLAGALARLESAVADLTAAYGDAQP
ncbi:MAG: hypothetical protein AB7N65_01880 [Vicinamibacterales bacterium]